MIQTSEQIDAISAALVKAQADIENIAKTGKNPHFKSSYATLADVLDELRPKFAKHGIYIMQAAINGEGATIGVSTRLLHSSGQWIESTLYVAPIKFDAQGAGSTVTYLRRYGLMAMAGVGAEDDDGEAAVGRPQAPARTNGATRTASAPPTPAPLNKAALPPSPEETPEVTAARQRIRMLINKIDAMIKSAPNDHVLSVGMDDALDEFKEIEAAGENGKKAADELRERYNERMATLREQAA
jgi:hypothetical protein